MPKEQEMSYEDLKLRLEHAEALLQAMSEGAGEDVSDGRSALVSRLFEAEARETHIKRVLLAIRNVNQLIVRESDRQRLISLACSNLTETLGYHNAWIALLDESQAVIMTGVFNQS